MQPRNHQPNAGDIDRGSKGANPDRNCDAIWSFRPAFDTRRDSYSASLPWSLQAHCHNDGPQPLRVVSVCVIGVAPHPPRLPKKQRKERSRHVDVQCDLEARCEASTLGHGLRCGRKV
jgi:hypothetical protein